MFSKSPSTGLSADKENGMPLHHVVKEGPGVASTKGGLAAPVLAEPTIQQNKDVAEVLPKPENKVSLCAKTHNL